MRRRENPAGLEFGELTVIKTVAMAAGTQIVECKCSCGAVVTCRLQLLKHGEKKSCGCKSYKGPVITDHAGERHGKLTVVRRLNEKRGVAWLWLCQCDCGNMTKAVAAGLRNGSKASCGCVKSYKEEVIADWLSQNGYDFQREVMFEECRRSRPLPFDFSILIRGEHRLVEYHGMQHYKPTKRAHDKLKETKDSDAIKRAFCDNYGIPLLVLDHTHSDMLGTLDWFLTSDL